MPSSMPISSSSAPSIIGHHNHNLHHLHQQPVHRHPHQTHQLNALIHSQIPPPQTGLQATTSTSLPHHHYHGSTSSSSSSSTLTSTTHPLAPSSIHHHAAPHLALHSHVTPSTLTSLQQQQTNHLPQHGHLISEIYDINANKRPRLITNPYNPNAATGIHPMALAVSNSSNTTSGVPMITIPASHIGYPPTSLIHPHFQHTVNNNKIVVDPLLQSTSNLRSTLPLNQQLLIETNEENTEDGYNPHFEAISPTPNDDSRVSPFTTLKDQILSAIHTCDRQIQTCEQHVNQLRSQAQELEMATRKPPVDPEEEIQKNISRNEPTLVQKIYLENSIKAKKAHQLHNCKENSSLNGETILNILPLYNQPIDIRETRQMHENFLKNREKLMKYIRKKNDEKKERYRERADKYDESMMKWLKKIELIESDPAKKARDAKMREYFEKQFPELKKKREDRERLQRGAQRVRSDADFEEIMDGLQDQELSDKKMHSYAVIPPIMYDDDERRKRIKYNNQNGFLKDPMALHKQHKMINIWTDGEKAIFREKYLTHPKKFGFVAQFLERKSIADCVEYYYLSKKTEHYKQVLSKHNKKRTRAVIRAQQQNLLNQQQQPVGLLSRSVDSSGTGTSFKKYKPATSFILPYSMPLASSTNTITFTILPSTNSSTSNDLTFSASSSSSTSQVSNGPLIVSSNSTVTSVSCLTTTSSTSVASTTVKCDSVNNNTMATNDGTNCDNSGSVGNSSIDLTNNCCLICKAKIPVNCPLKYRTINPTNIHLYNIKLPSLTNGSADNGNKIYGRICTRCHQKKNVRRQTHCPIPSCFNNQNNNSTSGQKRKVKGLKSLPLQWIEMSNDSEIKQKWANELNIPIDAKFGCARCVMRVSRRIGLVSIRDGKTTSDQLASSPGSALVNSPSTKEDIRKLWLDNGEIEKLRSLIKLHGKDWSTISANFSSDSPKTSNDCYKAYLYFKNEFQLNSALKEYYQNTGFDSDGTDGEIMSTSSMGGLEDLSGDEAVLSFDGPNNNNETSDTASASSSNGCVGKPETDAVDPTTISKSNLQDYKPLSLSQGSLKSDYDSSATMSADESSNTNDNVDRSSGLYSFSRSSKFENQNSSAKTDDFKQSITPPNSTYSGLYSNRDKLEFDAPQVPTFLINPNAPSVSINTNQTHHTTPPPSSSTLHHISSGNDHHNYRSNSNNEISGINGGGTCVRDLIYKAIEISLQTEDKTQSTASNNTEQVKTPPVSSTGNISNGSSGLNLKRDTPLQPQTLATDLSNKGVDQRKNLLNENIKPEGLAMNLSYGQRPLSRDESEVCEAQDLSNKSKDRLSSRLYDGNRHSPQNKIKFDNRSSPLQISKPSFSSTHSIVDQRSVPFSTQLPYNTIQPAHSNNPTSRISNLLPESYINTVPIPSNIDCSKSRSTTNPHQSPYNLPPSSTAGSVPMKISSKPQLSAFPISPKSETIIRDKIIQPSPIGSGSITQGTPVILQQPQPSVSSQQQLPPLSHASSQPYVALNSKFPPSPFHHYNEPIFRHISNDYSKGSITQGTPLILNSNSVLLSQQPPLIPTSTPSPHHSQLVNIRNNNNSSSSNNKMNDSLDFVYNKRMRYLDPKSSAQPNIGYDLIDRFARNNYEVNSALSHQTPPPPPQQLPIYHRPFSPSPSNYSKLLANQPSVSNNQKDSHLNNHQIFIDFNTSKQMQPRRSSSSSEKEQSMPSSSHPELPGSRSIPTPADKRSTPFHVSPAPSPAPAIFLPTDRVTEKIDQWNLASSSLINRQNVIQQCYPSASKQSTSVIQTVPPSQSNPRDFRDEILLKNSIIPGSHFQPENNDALSTLVNTAIPQSNSSSSSSTSIQSRITKEGFEKCFSESSAQLPPSSTKHAISNRIIYPPIGSSLNENSHSDHPNKSNKDSSNDKLPRNNRDSRPSSVGHENNIDLSKMMQPRFVAPTQFMLPHLSDHEKLLLEQKKYSAGNFPMDFPLLALQQQQSQQASLAVDHRSTFRPEQFLAAATPGYFSNPGLKFSREQFSSEHFERELRQQMADNVAAIASNRAEQERLMAKSDESQSKSSRKSSTNIDTSTMDEASKLFSQSFQKDSQPNLAGNSGGITAANLIDAIITKQINTDSTKGPSSLGNYNTMLNRVKQQQQSLNCSPSTAPVPANKIMSTHSADERAIDFCIMNKISGGDSFGSNNANKSFGETILNMITDNIQNRSPTASPSSLSHNNSVRNKSSTNQFEGIAATAVAASGSCSTTTTSANNFKLRRALQPVDKPEDYSQSKRLASDVGSSAAALSSDSAIRQVIQMATSASTITTSITSTASSPSLSVPPIIKHIEPISPPTDTTSSAAISSHQNWPWPFLPGFYSNKPPSLQFTPSRLPEPSSISHLPGHSDFFIQNRIAEVMQRSIPSTANNTSNSGSNDGTENKSKAKITQQLTKKSMFKNEDKNAMNNIDADTAINSNKVHIDKNSFPDSPSSPGEMVIDENRPPSTPSPSESNLTSDSSKNCIKKGSVIKVNETCSTPEGSNNNTNNSINDPQPQYEPLSDDES